MASWKRVNAMSLPPKFRLFLAMDGVIVDFERYKADAGLASNELKVTAGVYRRMPPKTGAIAGVHKLMSLAEQYGGEVWLASTPLVGIAHTYCDKAAWVAHHLHGLRRNVIITNDGGLYGGREDYLVDVHQASSNFTTFKGTLIQFGRHGLVNSWPALNDHLHKKMRDACPAGRFEPNWRCRAVA